MKKLRYKRLYTPGHPRAYANKMVYVHVLVAEKTLGRFLEPKEYVHHVDENIHNNDPDNLMVFRTCGDHVRYHATGVAIQHADGAYSAPSQNICCRCRNKISGHLSRIKSGMCRTCFFETKPTCRPSLTALEQDILTLNFVAIGKKYNVSDTAVRKWCKHYGLPYSLRDVKNHRNLKVQSL